MRLKYIGNGQYLKDVPARDLTLEEIAAMGISADELIASGLYEEEKADEIDKHNHKRNTEHNQ